MKTKLVIRKLIILVILFVISYGVMCLLFNYAIILKQAKTGTYNFTFKEKYLLVPPAVFGVAKLLMFSAFLSLFATYKITSRMAIYESNQDIDGSARWINKKELKKAFYQIKEKNLNSAQKSGIILCRKAGKLFMDTETVNSLIIGTTRSGKSQTFVLPSIRAFWCGLMKQSIICNDPKGELLENSYDMLLQNGYKIIVLNLRDTNKSSLWNPLSVIIKEYEKAMQSQQKDISKVNKLVSGLAAVFTDNPKSDPVWPQSAKSLLTALILFLLDSGYKNNCLDKLNMYSVYNFFLEYGGKNYPKTVNGAKIMVNALDELFSELPVGNPAKLAFATSRFSAGEMRSSIFATLAGNIEIFGSDTGISKLTSGNDIFFEDLINPEQPCAIFMVVPDEEPSRQVIASLFVNQCYASLIDFASGYPGQKLPQRVHFILDEFGNMVRIPDMSVKMTICLGRNILFDLYVQDLNQIDSKYDHTAKTIRSNCNNLIYINSLDPDTNDYISRILGNQTIEYRTYSGNLNDWLNHQNINYKARALLTADELKRLEFGEVITQKQRCYPIRTRFEPFYNLKLPVTSQDDIPIGVSNIDLSSCLFPFDVIEGKQKVKSPVNILNNTKDEKTPLDKAFEEINRLTSGKFDEYLSCSYINECYMLINDLKMRQQLNHENSEILSDFLEQHFACVNE